MQDGPIRRAVEPGRGVLGPNGGGEPTGAIASAINEAFGNFENFKQQFNDAGVKRFGSGWTWLVRDASGKRVDVSFRELVEKTMGKDVPRADLHISRSRDGELFLTSRQDGMIRMLVPDESGSGTASATR